MKCDCLNCEQKEMAHTVRDVPYSYKGHHTVITQGQRMALFPLRGS